VIPKGTRVPIAVVRVANCYARLHYTLLTYFVDALKNVNTLVDVVTRKAARRQNTLPKVFLSTLFLCLCFRQLLARDVILAYTSRAYATMSVSVCLSVTEVHTKSVINTFIPQATIFDGVYHPV